MKYLLAALLLSALSFSQTAQVKQLTPQEATKAKQLYEAKQKADKAWEDFSHTVIAKYADWKGAGEFSIDFRFLVPASLATSGTLVWSGQTLCNPGFTYDNAAVTQEK